MTTQYSPILKLALPVQGELSGTWGEVVNDNITSMVEQAIAGRVVINTWTTNSHTLTTANGTTSESRCAMLELTDTGTALSGAGTVICPTASKIYIVKNASGQNITVKTASGTGILVPNGRTTFLFCDGTNVVEAMTHTTSLQLGTSTTVTAVLDEDNMASDSPTSLATQQSIKAYVDAQVGAFDSLAEVLAVGNTTGSNNIVVDNGQKITTNTIDETTAGSGVTIDSVLLKDDVVNATDVETGSISANDGTAAATIADSTGVVTVPSAVLTTADINGGTADGVVIGGSTPAAATATTVTANTSLNIAGTVTVTSILDEDNLSSDDPAGLATQQSIKAYVDAQVGTADELSEVLANGNTTGGTDLAVSTGDDITFADSSKAIFGAGSDLEIYSDGTHGIIKESGSGDLLIYGNNLRLGNADGSELYILGNNNAEVQLRHNNLPKLATTSTGIDVTGTVTADDTITLAKSSGANILIESTTTGASTGDIFGEIEFKTNDSNSSGIKGKIDSYSEGNVGNGALRLFTGDTTGLYQRLNIASNGDISFYESDGTTASFVYDASTGTTFNEAGSDRDFRVESDAASHMLFVDGGNNRIGINDTSPQQKVSIVGGSATSSTLELSGSTNDSSINDNSSISAPFSLIVNVNNQRAGNQTGRTFTIRDGGQGYQGGTEIARFGLTESVINDSGANTDFRVESDGNANMFTVNAGNNRVGVGTLNGLHTLSVFETGTALGGQGHFSIGTGAGAYQTTVFRLDANNNFAIDQNYASADRNRLFIERSTGYIGVGTEDPDQMIHVEQASGTTLVKTEVAAGSVVGFEITKTGTTTQNWRIVDGVVANGQLDIYDVTGSRSIMAAKSTEIVFNDTSTNLDFRVESDGDSNAIFVDAGNNNVILGGSSVDAAGSFGYKLTTDDIRHVRPSGVTGDTLIAGVSGVSNGFQISDDTSNNRTYKFHNVGSQSFFLGMTEAAFNEGGLDRDFRVESDTLPNAFFVNGATSKIGIGEGAVGGTDDWTGANWTGIMFKEGSTIAGYNAAAYPAINITENGFPNAGSFITGFLRSNTGSATNIQLDRGDMFFRTAASAAAGSAITWVNTLSLYDNSNGAVFNEGGSDRDFRVESDSNAHMLFVDGGANKVGVGESGPEGLFHVTGASSGGGQVWIQTNGGFAGTDNASLNFRHYDDTGDPNAQIIVGGTTNYTGDMIFKVRGGGTTGAGGAILYEFMRMRGNERELVVNQDGANQDFRVESDLRSQAIYLDGATSALRLDCSGAVQTSKANWLTGAQNQLEVGVASQPSYNSGVSYGGIKFRDNGWGSPVFSIAVSSNSGNGTVRGYGNYVDFVIKTNSGSNTFATPLALRPTSVIVTGSLSKSSGSFRIPHPVASKTETHDLVHSFVEGPQADNIYRGKVDLVSGSATVNIDIVAGMTDGTFDALNREVQCFTTNESGWTAIKGSVSGNILTITAQDNDCADTISWMVIGERKDVHMYDTDWTDDNGKVIVEPLKSAEE